MAKNELRRKYLRKQIVFKYYIHDLYPPHPKSSSYRSLAFSCETSSQHLHLITLIYEIQTLFTIRKPTDILTNKCLVLRSIRPSARPHVCSKKELS